ncbi:Lin1244/Lin1753 domain-containing protein [Parabacteroides distasonis]|uniref:Lin1244/Lin1753-like N-terminal domain-containing protein n=2 Tax=Parabacteroides distasonis TaxID=823 RepID=A0A173VIY8_PARDI|nr:Lin1244/Lin1753 domain-containing protein [Parabacteroides distasonis]CUN26115.1 Uncharacterised protein [Parabacteroides distasonis]
MDTRKELTSYFPHDSNARNSDKLIRLRMRHKAAGYGVFFMILERLREEPNYMSVKDYNMIAFDLREDASLIKSVIEDFGLFVFTEDGKYFYSESFKQRMGFKDEKSRKRSEAGKLGMAKRWGNNNVITNPQSNDNNVITKTDEIITRKEKERKEKEIPPLSPTGGSGGGSFFNLSRNDPPPSDGVKRNYEALTRELTNFKLSPDEFNTICELSNYGEIGNPVWKLLQRIRDSREGKYKIDHPGRFLISRLKNND